ncbi:MAG: hypothetical protein KDE31_13155 [Caldilineaceae bacterium]|nr:hypothetical protein [Caldilineaceae bacterium]
MSIKPYKIIETAIGPMISESRTSVYDVLISQQEGEEFDSICVIHNLRPLQVRVALEYIEAHRAELEAELPGILARKAENERYHRAIAAERAQRPVVMTPARHAFYELLAKRREGNGPNGPYHPG